MSSLNEHPLNLLYTAKHINNFTFHQLKSRFMRGQHLIKPDNIAKLFRDK